MERVNRRQRANMTPEQYNVFRTEMRRLRKDAHLTCGALGELLDCTAVHVGNIERGNRYPSNELAKDIADVFGTSVEAMCISESDRVNAEMTNTGKELLEKRIARGFRINEVAGFLGASREAYVNMEAGKSNIPDSMKEALDRLYKTEEHVETIEVIKEVPTASPISLEVIEKILPHIVEMDMPKHEQKVLYRELSEVRTKMLEEKLFG